MADISLRPEHGKVYYPKNGETSRGVSDRVTGEVVAYRIRSLEVDLSIDI